MNNNYTILIVDDESIEREAIKFILNKADIGELEIYEAANGQDAISSTALYEPDIILMDIQMPGLNGIEATKIIKKIAPETKVIFLTAYNQFDYAHEAIKLGVEEFIIKPATNERFIKVIKATIDMIQKTIVQNERKVEMEVKLQKVSKYLENEFIMALITGDSNKEQTNEYLDFHGITLRSAMGAVVHMDINVELISSNIQQQMLKKRFLEKIKKKFDIYLENYYMLIEKDYIYVLIFGKDSSELLSYQQSIRTTFIEVGDTFAKSNNIFSDFYIGDPYQDISQVWKSFASAKSECNKKSTSEYIKSKEFVAMLVKAIIDEDEVTLTEHCNYVGEQLGIYGLTMEHLKVKLYELIILISDSLSNHMIYKRNNTIDLFEQVMKIESYVEGKRLLRNVLHQFMDMAKASKLDKTALIMDKLITYINSHYNENITLEQLAEISGRSSYYLSKLFKKYVEMNFIDYLAFVRIKVGKRMLKNPQYSIKEISYEIGYGDPNYFTRVFKKYENMTPTEYRNLNQLSDEVAFDE